jgi:CDP-diacylglycerol--serine O-phosphatidyltransferase
MKNQIPNSITTLSLILSCLAIVFTFEGRLELAAYFLIVSLACDYFDGFTARVLKVNNPIGKEIDSLVDMVAFGVAPSLLLYQHLKILQANPEHSMQLITDNPWLLYLVFLIPIFSSFRLAKFNIDTRQTTSFIGLAVPAHAAFYIFSVLIFQLPDLPQIINVNHLVLPVVSNPLIMLIMCVLLSLMLIAEVPMFSLKVKQLKWKGNELPFIFILLWLLLFIFTGIVAMPTIVILYCIFSIVDHFFLNKKPLESA